jgi:redox-sensing transcriptional repressor
MKVLPEKTVERLSKYRRVLSLELEKDEKYIFSHELANLLHLTSVQVRRDLMLIEYSGSHKRGYEIQQLIDHIGKIIDPVDKVKIVVIGMGNFGKAIAHYFVARGKNFEVIAGFDRNEAHCGLDYNGIPCMKMEELESFVQENDVKIGVIAVPPDEAENVLHRLVNAGIRGVLNYTPKPLTAPDDIFIEEYDVITSFEKVNYFIS